MHDIPCRLDQEAFDLLGMDQSWNSSQWQQVGGSSADNPSTSAQPATGGQSDSDDDFIIPQLDGPGDEKGWSVSKTRDLDLDISY